MANFKAVVRKKRADGFYPVYIRIVHRSRMGYIKTSKIVTDKQLSKTGEIKDPVVNDYCSREILRYSDLVNRKDVSHFSVAELIEYLNNLDEEVNFSEYANKFIALISSSPSSEVLPSSSSIEPITERSGSTGRDSFLKLSLLDHNEDETIVDKSSGLTRFPEL